MVQRYDILQANQPYAHDMVTDCIRQAIIERLEREGPDGR